MNGNVFTIIVTIINFFVLMAILKHFFFDKVSSVVEERSNEVKDTLDKANLDRKAAESLRIENEKNLQQSKVEGKKIVESYKEKAEKLSEKIKEEASIEAELTLERTRKDIEREKEKAQSEIRNQVIDLALLISSKALEGSIDENQHRKLIKDFIAKVGI
ncbi:F0F1 ATP synthase subunit B [Clostridium sp. WILCCON 0269]|uniref:ATP synthase subunit b n=1 Tax=Candidatus Clostridium eludens TaxID=3381663 RepID=A0ABW8SK22_9CLOT